MSNDLWNFAHDYTNLSHLCVFVFYSTSEMLSSTVSIQIALWHCQNWSIMLGHILRITIFCTKKNFINISGHNVEWKTREVLSRSSMRIFSLGSKFIRPVSVQISAERERENSGTSGAAYSVIFEFLLVVMHTRFLDLACVATDFFICSNFNINHSWDCQN